MRRKILEFICGFSFKLGILLPMDRNNDTLFLSLSKSIKVDSYIPCVPGIVTVINKEFKPLFFSFVLLCPNHFELIIHQKFKARAHLPAYIRISLHVFFTLPACIFHFEKAIISGTHSRICMGQTLVIFTISGLLFNTVGLFHQ